MVKEFFRLPVYMTNFSEKTPTLFFIYFFCCRDYCIILSEKLPSVASATSLKWKKRIS